MFGFLRKRQPSIPPWSCLMGWRVLTYQEGAQWLSMQIEPMKHGHCRVYVPGPAAWLARAPVWARGLRETVLERVSGIDWNRDLQWCENERTNFWHRHVGEPVDGSLESTPGGRQLEVMRLFHPDSPLRFSKAEAKRAWCSGAEQMCLQARGKVSIDARELIVGSVFQEVELPALKRNPNVELALAGAA